MHYGRIQMFSLVSIIWKFVPKLVEGRLFSAMGNVAYFCLQIPLKLDSASGKQIGGFKYWFEQDLPVVWN